MLCVLTQLHLFFPFLIEAPPHARSFSFLTPPDWLPLNIPTPPPAFWSCQARRLVPSLLCFFSVSSPYPLFLLVSPLSSFLTPTFASPCPFGVSGFSLTFLDKVSEIFYFFVFFQLVLPPVPPRHFFILSHLLRNIARPLVQGKPIGLCNLSLPLSLPVLPSQLRVTSRPL